MELLRNFSRERLRRAPPSDREVRNRLTDHIEDFEDVFGVVYVGGARVGSSRPPSGPSPEIEIPWTIWELLGLLCQPVA